MSFRNDPDWWAVERHAHTISFVEHEGFARARCTCGWFSRAREKRIWAGYEADDHLEEIAAECERELTAGE